MNKENLKLQSNGCNLNVTKVTNENAKSVIVVLHGGPGSGAQPVMDLPAFQTLENTFSMVYFDQRGSGQSEYDLTKNLTIEQITDDVKNVVDFATKEFKGKNVYLWGGSFGGLLGLLFLQRYPTSVDKAIMSSPAIYIFNEYSHDSQLRYLQEVFSQLLPTPLAEKMKSVDAKVDAFESVMNIPEFTQWIHENKTPQQGYEGVWHFYAMRNWIYNCDMRSVIKDIEIETLFLMGKEDPFLPAEILIDAVKQYPNPNVSLKTFSPCGHGVFEDCEQEFCKICTDFYQNT